MKYFNTGGATGTTNTGLTGATTRAEESSLSSWAGPYVTDMLGRGQALATQMPYTPYTGPLTPGTSSLQTQAFQGLGSLNMPTAGMGAFNPQSFTGMAPTAPTAQQTVTGGLANTFGIDPNVNTSGLTGVSFSGMNTVEDQAKAREMGLTPLQYAQAGGMGANVDQTAMQAAAQQPMQQSPIEQYMTPYLQGALQPQYDAANRQALIAAQNLQSQYGKAGAYGGSRQGVAEAELQRGLLDRMAGITGTGYQQAFEQAQKQFNTEQDRARQAQELTNKYGFDVANALQDAGMTQRNIEGQGIAADVAQFEQERDYPYKQIQFMQSLLQGLPLETQSYQYYEPSGLQSLSGGASAVKNIYDTLEEILK
jgi:hypothetical protein